MVTINSVFLVGLLKVHNFCFEVTEPGKNRCDTVALDNDLVEQFYITLQVMNARIN